MGSQASLGQSGMERKQVLPSSCQLGKKPMVALALLASLMSPRPGVFNRDPSHFLNSLL